MKNLVRGGAILSVVAMLVVLVYAQSQTSSTLVIANDSQPKIEDINTENTLVSNFQQQDGKKLVKPEHLVQPRIVSKAKQQWDMAFAAASLQQIREY